jgi:hypothetical protein
MSETTSYPYETRLNIHCQQGEVIDERALANACAYKWYNQTLCQVNESVVRLGVVQRKYHWHKHDDARKVRKIEQPPVAGGRNNEVAAIGIQYNGSRTVPDGCRSMKYSKSSMDVFAWWITSD